MNWPQGLEDVAKLAGAYVLALPVGWYREKEAHSVGVRTIPVVAMASCAYVLMGTGWEHISLDAQSRIVQGIAAGIGFVGGGAILKSENHVHGTATAASIWNIAAVGAAVAIGRYPLAVALSAINLLALRLLLPVKRAIDRDEAGPPASPSKPSRDD